MELYNPRGLRDFLRSRVRLAGGDLQLFPVSRQQLVFIALVSPIIDKSSAPGPHDQPTRRDDICCRSSFEAPANVSMERCAGAIAREQPDVLFDLRWCCGARL